MVQLTVFGSVELMTGNTLRHLGVPSVEQNTSESTMHARGLVVAERTCVACVACHTSTHAASARAAGRTGTGWDI
jgi:mono/diheme cytochrome c family protein